MSDPMEIDPFATGSAPDSPRAASPSQPAHGEHPGSDGDDDPSASTSTAGPGPNAEQQQQKQQKPLHQQQPSHRPPPPQSQLPTSRRAYNERAAGEPLSGVARHLAQDGWTIEITDAYKTTEGSKSAYIVYVIRTGTIEARRRYSEFESLRASLAKLYPTLIVPPIPDKTSVTEFAARPTKAREDASLVARRTRMLQGFLNRIAKHPILGHDLVFHRFLDGGVSWSEILHSPPLTHLPKNPLKAPAHDPTDTTSAAAYAALPVPPAGQPLREPDARFLESEAFTRRFESHLSGSMERVNRRVLKRWGEHSNDYAELGAVLNGFSLTETGTLSAAIERVGQAVDATYLSTTHLLQQWEASWTEPLTDYAHFGQIIRKLLLYRHQRHLQYELTSETLASKRAQLAQLERAEDEARRLERSLAAFSSPSASGTAGGRREESDGGGGYGGSASPTAEGGPSSPPAAPSSVLPPPRRTASSTAVGGGGGGGYGFLSAISHSITGMIDVDPEQTRRTNISKTRDTISQLEEALQLAGRDLKYSSQAIQADLDRFQRQKVADIRGMGVALATAHRDWCKHNLEAWLEAKAAIDAIEPHPANPPTDQPATAAAATSNAAPSSSTPANGATAAPMERQPVVSGSESGGGHGGRERSGSLRSSNPLAG